MRLWDDLKIPTTKFVQCPFELLDAHISDKAKILYLHLWRQAFTQPKWYKGYMYTEMNYEQICKFLNCNRTYARNYIKELTEHKLIETKHGKTLNKYFFVKPQYWR